MGDTQSKAHELEVHDLELDDWVVLANRIFDGTQYGKALESLNYAVVQESVHLNEKFIKKR